MIWYAVFVLTGFVTELLLVGVLRSWLGLSSPALWFDVAAVLAGGLVMAAVTGNAQYAAFFTGAAVALIVQDRSGPGRRRRGKAGHAAGRAARARLAAMRRVLRRLGPSPVPVPS